MLDESLKLLDQRIVDADKDTSFDKTKLSEMKEQQQILFIELANLNMLQWDNDHPKTNFNTKI
jgi:hypothetical protein